MPRASLRGCLPPLSSLSALLLLCAAVSGAGACGDDYRDFDASVLRDAGVPDEGVGGEGGVPVKAVFTVAGCDRLEFDAAARAVCTSTRGRPLTFIPLGTGVDTWVWTFQSGLPPSSTLLTPEVRWDALGTYAVSLTVGGNGGAALGTATVLIVPVGAGGTCLSDLDCDGKLGLSCLCGGSSGGGCPAELAGGLCLRRCESSPCAPAELCVDLTRGGLAGAGDGGVGDGGASEPFRVRACLPSCTTGASCRAGLQCRELPTVAVGASALASYAWERACFGAVLSDVGTACRDTLGNLDGSSCLTGRCEAFGARGMCTDLCDATHACPSSAVCATLPSVGSRCLPRCVVGATCGDPLLACQTAGAGGLGFSLPATEPVATTLCAPKRCAGQPDCAPAGSCSSVGGALFCIY